MSCGNGSFKKNPWLAERSQVTTRWGKKSPTFDDGDASMEVFPLNSNVCVLVWIYIRMCVYFWLQTDHPAHMRTHTHPTTLKCVLIFESFSNTALQVPLSSCSTESRRTPVAQKTKSHWLKQWRKKETKNRKKLNSLPWKSLNIT